MLWYFTSGVQLLFLYQDMTAGSNLKHMSSIIFKTLKWPTLFLAVLLDIVLTKQHIRPIVYLKISITLHRYDDFFLHFIYHTV